MKASHLRIGNWVNYPIHDEMEEVKDFVEVSKIDAEDIMFIERNQDNVYDPIPLTEEWLLKFGFTLMYDNPGESNPFYKPLKPNKGIEIYPPKKDNRKPTFFQFNVGGVRSQFYTIDVKHVHQLQNLYFALTGEELTVNEK